VRQRLPTKASIIISNVVRGRWKLVISTSTVFHSYGRWMNRRERPSATPSVAALSSARTLVVPTATTRRAAAHAAAVAAGTR
jgi:hypothetical protein